MRQGRGNRGYPAVIADLMSVRERGQRRQARHEPTLSVAGEAMPHTVAQTCEAAPGKQTIGLSQQLWVQNLGSSNST